MLPALSPFKLTRLTGLVIGLVGVMQRPIAAQHGSGLIQIINDAVHVMPELKPMPLTVRPKDMVLGSATPKAGEIVLDSVAQSLVYVPKQCVGKKRCPLILTLHPSVSNGQAMIDGWRQSADDYGFIILAPTSQHDWQLSGEEEDHSKVDAAMKDVLGRFAIDTSRIAIAASSASGGGTIAFGGGRLDLFKRVILSSTDFSISNVDPRNKSARFFMNSAVTEAREHFNQLTALRRDGHPVDHVIELRTHGGGAKARNVAADWLYQSWRPTRAQRPSKARVIVLPPLTSDVLRKIAIFWERFVKEPDNIKTDARVASIREVIVPVGRERPSVWMMNTAALAAKYPSVAASLRAAGLTAGQHDAYRAALISARAGAYALKGPVINGPHGDVPYFSGAILDSIDVLQSAGPAPITIPKGTVQGKNVQFFLDHKAEFEQLGEMWVTP